MISSKINPVSIEFELLSCYIGKFKLKAYNHKFLLDTELRLLKIFGSDIPIRKFQVTQLPKDPSCMKMLMKILIVWKYFLLVVWNLEVLKQPLRSMKKPFNNRTEKGNVAVNFSKRIIWLLVSFQISIKSKIWMGQHNLLHQSIG